MTESRRRWTRFSKNRLALASLLLLLMVHLTAFLAPLLAPYSPQQIDLLRRFAPISTEHPLGTDENGRDVLSRLMFGGRVSLGVGFVAVLVAITSGLAFLSAERESSAARFSASAGAL